MAIDRTVQGTVTVLAPEGPVVGEATDELVQEIKDLRQGGCERIVLEMNGVPFIDSDALEKLLAASLELETFGGALKIANPSDVVRDIFRATRLGSRIDVMDDVEGARKSLLA